MKVFLKNIFLLFLTSREECRLRVFENRILWLIYWPKRDEIEEWGRFINEELHSLYVHIMYSGSLDIED